jgi:hypothetical protein
MTGFSIGISTPLVLHQSAIHLTSRLTPLLILGCPGVLIGYYRPERRIYSPRANQEPNDGRSKTPVCGQPIRSFFELLDSCTCKADGE